MHEKYTNESYLIHLIDSAMRQAVPDEKEEQLSFERLYKLAVFHGVANLTFYSIEKLQKKPERDIFKEWKEERDRNINRSFIQLAERDLITEQLTGAGTKVLPLKGCLLKEMYPQADYRQMADIDILFDKQKANQVKGLMESLGYECQHFNAGNHDVYYKEPYMNAELHQDLIGEGREYASYYEHIWDRAMPDAENKNLYHFSWDDYYIYMLVHLKKHYDGGGSGIRSVLDIHVFLNNHRDDLHWDYLEKELQTIGLWTFKQDMEQLAALWFQEGRYQEQLGEMSSYIISSGTYGTMSNYMNNRIKALSGKKENFRIGKIRYFFRRVFLDRISMRSSYPILNKCPVLLPLCWIHRLIHAVLFKSKKVKTECGQLKKIS